MLNNIIYTKKCFIMSNKAEAVPPLGTILGNIGVNTIKFCDEFNVFTKNLPLYFLLKVFIFINENKSFRFIIKEPSVGFLLNILKFKKNIKIKVYNRLHEKVISCIYLKDVIQISLFKFNSIDLKKSIHII